MITLIAATRLDVACSFHGPDDGWPVVLVHGFPYDHHAYDEVAPILAARGARVIVPSMRGYGETRFRAASTLRSGQQAAFGADLLALLDALKLDRAVLGGYDWGGRAACVVAALWPERCAGLVTCGGYNIQDIAGSGTPVAPEAEQRLWYQYYLHGERGRRGIAENRRAFAKLLWKMWSPKWSFDDATFDRSATSFDNPDFVDVVVHSYRHRFALVEGDPAYAEIEARLAGHPDIGVPAIALFGDADGVSGPVDAKAVEQRRHFTARYDARVLPEIGHDVPQEAPQAFAKAVLDVRGMASSG